MANEEHLAMLRQGVVIWNQWRIENSNVGPLLSSADLLRPHIIRPHIIRPHIIQADLRGADLREANLREANLHGADLRGADLREANLHGADLIVADLSEANLSGANLFEAHLSSADLSSANLSGANLIGANLHGANLVEANLHGADLIVANLVEAHLSFANLVGAHLSFANLTDADLSSANLIDADLNRAHLSGANLLEADLRDANLVEAILIQANLSRAHLSGANFHYANLNGAILHYANLNGAILGWTALCNVDLSEVKGLETIRHDGPTSIGIDTIYKSKGNIPYNFLLDAGIPKDHIAYLLSLAGKAIDFYSCFISHSSHDHRFAERLHADLQAQGIRTWFAPEDMKTGDKIRSAIDHSIRIHDKLLLILTQQALESSWVESEVEAALEEERERKQQGRGDETVLFPIRLDETIMAADVAWAKEVRRTRHIGDFTQWKDHDAYQKAFARLLRDLKATNTDKENKQL